MVVYIFAILINSFVFADCQNPFIDDSSAVIVNRVIDGDTFSFLIKGEEIHVRILNIDTYESKRNKRLKEQATRSGISPDSALTLGLQAKRFADSLLTGNPVLLLRNRADKNLDVYNRLLRIVIINNQRYDSLITSKGLTVTK